MWPKKLQQPKPATQPLKSFEVNFVDSIIKTMYGTRLVRLHCGLYVNAWWESRQILVNYLVVPYASIDMVKSLHRALVKEALRAVIEESRKHEQTLQDLLEAHYGFAQYGLACGTITRDAVALYEDDESSWGLPLVRLHDFKR